MLYRFYTLFGTACCFLILPFLPLIQRLGGRIGYGLAERFGRYQAKGFESRDGNTRIWVHAASVGEVQVAINLIAELEQQGGVLFFLTVMTEQGHRMAQKKLAGRAICLMAPIDEVRIVRRAIDCIRPEAFVCIETEIWPVLLTEVHRAGVPMNLVNGRLSENSFRHYLRIKKTMRRVLAGFSAVAVIRREDGERFAALGVPEERILISGNSKYGGAAADGKSVRKQYRQRLGIGDAIVFICGSTRTGEEELLIPVYEKLRRHCGNRLIWIIAPRHLERLPLIKKLLARHRITAAAMSSCSGDTCPAEVLLVDSVGELAYLYAAGDINFCGGSLVDRGGHNIMEAVAWGRPVYFGPFMRDFRDAVELVLPAGAGFQVADANELAELLVSHLQNREKYDQACLAAGQVSLRQSGAIRLQAELVEKSVVRPSAEP